MTIPARPHYQPQVPRGQSNSCVLGGKPFGWLNCTPTSFAMAIEKASLGRLRPTGCNIREATGDRTAGTTLWQCRTVAENEYGIAVEVHAGATVTSMVGVARQLRAGRGAVLQGDIGVAVGTSFRSTAGSVAHAIYLNEVRGGSIDTPSQALVYDPAANGRTARWGTAAQGPQWWPWGLVVKFAAALRPNGPGTPVLGPGKAYVAFFPDTEPHVHLTFGGNRTNPFPDDLFGKKGTDDAARYVRPGPGLQYAHLRVLGVGARFGAFQVTHGGQWRGSDIWYGDHNGHYWIHSSGITGAGVQP